MLREAGARAVDRVRHKNIRDAVAVIRTPYYVLLPAILFLLAPDILQVFPCPTAISSVLVLLNGPSSEYVEMLANMSRTAEVEYSRYHGMVVPGAVPNQAARAGATCKTAGIVLTSTSPTSPCDFHKCTVTPGSTTSGNAGVGSAAGAWQCACGKICPSGQFLARHRRMCGGRRATAIDEEEEEEEAEDGAGSEEDTNGMDIAKVEGEVLQTYGELHYEHFLSGAAVQQHKAACKSVTSAQSTAIKRALEGKLMPGVDLDSIINPIMDAAENTETKVPRRQRSKRD